MQLKEKEFQRQLRRFIPFRGIDIVLYLKDGSKLELDKNRVMEGDLILRNTRSGLEKAVDINEVVQADFFAA